jgi:hypothetical protein
MLPASAATRPISIASDSAEFTDRASCTCGMNPKFTRRPSETNPTVKSPTTLTTCCAPLTIPPQSGQWPDGSRYFKGLFRT